MPKLTDSEWTVLDVLLANFVVAIRIVAQLFDLRRVFPKPEEMSK